MKKIITNFSTKENQKFMYSTMEPPTIITMDKVIKHNLCRCNYFEDIYNLKKQFAALIENYPNALNDDDVLATYQKLQKYAAKNRVSLENCYSYRNKEYNPNHRKEGIKWSDYGVKIIPDYRTINIKYIDITGYHFLASRDLIAKHQLILKSKNGIVANYNMTIADTNEFIFEKDALDYIEKKAYVKTNKTI